MRLTHPDGVSDRRPNLQESEAVKTPMTNTLRSTPSRALVCLLAFLMARPHMVIASAAPVAEAVPATSATPENSADEQSGGVSPTDRLCTFLTPCESWPVPPLLNLDQGSYVPTPEQKESLRALEAQAVANVIKGHGLTDADTDAVKTWGRYDALADAVHASSPRRFRKRIERRTSRTSPTGWRPPESSCRLVRRRRRDANTSSGRAWIDRRSNRS